MTLIQDCPRCLGAHADCALCLGDGHVMTGYGLQAYEIARQVLDDASAGRDHPTRHVDHSSPRHTCDRCQPPRQASA